jgi:predicted Zn-dependent protease
MRRQASVLLAVVLAFVFAATTGCAGKDKPKAKKRTVLSTEYHDAKVGEQASRDIAAEVGVLDDPALNKYVSDIGNKLLRGVPRRSFHYQFMVIDQTEPNAFALPGGYIFISRGLLSLANSEDELACVIGHEITHAHRRHAAAQQALDAAQNKLSMPYIRAANLAAYGRDMEREADEGGQILCAAAGYDPMGMSTFLQHLGSVERLIVGHARLPTFYDTHPGSTERAAANAVRASELRWTRDKTLGDTHLGYLRRVNGLPLGQRPESGVFIGQRFLHPDLDFQLTFPPGWRTQNTNRAVGAASPRGDGVLFLSVDMPDGPPAQLAHDFLEKMKEDQPVELVSEGTTEIAGIDGYRLTVEGGRGHGAAVADLYFFPYRGATWRITAMAQRRAFDAYHNPMQNAVRSFGPLTDDDRAQVRSTRLRMVFAQPGEDVKALGQRTGNAWNPGHTAVYNGLFVDHRFDGGELVKIARHEPYVTKAPPVVSQAR